MMRDFIKGSLVLWVAALALLAACQPAPYEYLPLKEPGHAARGVYAGKVTTVHMTGSLIASLTSSTDRRAGNTLIAFSIPAVDQCLVVLPHLREVGWQQYYRIRDHELRHCNGEEHDEKGVWR